MAFSIGKQDMLLISEAATAATTAWDAVEEAVTKYNDTLATAWQDVESAVTKFNDEINAAQQVIGDIAGNMREQIEEKSDNWKEGDRGQAAEEWVAGIEDIAERLEEIEVQEPEAIEVERPDVLDEIDGIEANPSW